MLAWIKLRRGDLEAAEHEALAALPLLTSTPRFWTAARSVLADIQLAQGRAAEALSITAELLSAQRAFPPGYAADLYPLVIDAEARAALGDLPRAAEVLAEARDELLARAAEISDPAIRKNFLEGVPEHARILARAGEWLVRRPSIGA